MAEANPIARINDELLPAFVKEQTRSLNEVDNYFRGIHKDPFKPHDPSLRQYKTLMARCKLNLLDLVVKTRSQGLRIEGFRSNDPDATNAKVWQFWNDNRLDSRQEQLWTTTLEYGVAYATVLPGTVRDSTKVPAIRAYSPRTFMAFYEDPANDEWPVCGIHVQGLTDGHKLPSVKIGSKRARVRFFDDTFVIEYVQGDGRDEWVEVDRYVHGSDVCPVVRFTNNMDLEGRYLGEVEPMIELQDRLNQTLFDLLMTQTFNSFKVRWISGVMLGQVDADGNPVDPGGAVQQKMRLAQNVMLAFADPDTKMGALPETAMNPFIDASLFAIRQFAIKSQTPPQNFLGDIGGNIAAEALSALEDSAERKTAVCKQVLGEAAGQLLRLSAAMGGLADEADDYSLEVKWAETETRSLAQVADAWGKIAVMLEVPVEQIWDRIPGVTSEDVQRFKKAKVKEDAKLLAQQMAMGGVNDSANPGNASGGTGSSSRVVRPAASQLGSPFGGASGATATGSNRGGN